MKELHDEACKFAIIPSALFLSIPILALIAYYSGNSHLLPLIIVLMLFSLCGLILWVMKNNQGENTKEMNRIKNENDRIWNLRNINWEIGPNGSYLHLCVDYPQSYHPKG